MLSDVRLFVVAGFGLGLLYFWLEEATQEKEANCSYLASPLTDALAFAGAGVIMWRGFAHRDPVLATVGAAVAGIHSGQLAHHKELFKQEA